MKVVILAGGYGTRISEETSVRPKPMVEIGGKPILWHIMKIYSCYGLTDFIICCGYKGYMIKEYFANYFLHESDITLNMLDNKMEVLQKRAENWKITLVDTGETTMTGGRLKRIKKYLNINEPFCFTYGDGLSNINISDLIKFHHAHGKLATITATYPPGRFGALEIEGNQVKSFKEKPKGDGALINGGFFILSPQVIDRINDDNTVWEQEPLNTLAKDEELFAFIHDDFWQPMDTLRDKLYLEKMWENKEAKWKIW